MLAEVNWGAILGAGSAGVAVTAITNYFLAARKMSGKIDRSDAGQLWSEAASIREEQRLQIDRQSDRSLSLEIRVAKLEERNNSLEAENLRLKTEVEACKRQGETMRQRIVELESQAKGDA